MIHDRECFHCMLSDERQRLQEGLGALQPAGGISDAGSLDDGSRLSEEDRTLRLRMQVRGWLDDIEHALEKWEQGTYGCCDGCGQPIPVERLEIRPQASRCVPCSGKSRR